MSDAAFERQLAKAFAEIPELPNAQGFADRVCRRLDRSWTTRRVLISLAGLAGGGVATVQFMDSTLLRQATLASRSSLAGAQHVLDRVVAKVDGSTSALATIPLGGEALWLVAALVFVAGALLLTRLLEDI